MTLHYEPILKNRSRDLRKNSTLAEILLWQEIKNRKLGYKFIRQQPIGWYIADFYCATASLVIEIDGDSHDLKQKYDEDRDRYLKSLGINVLRFHDLDVKKNIDGVLVEIKKALNTPDG